ncbi:hypothetical protein EJ02DRAFT_355731, partial [Clathrospora elynae]
IHNMDKKGFYLSKSKGSTMIFSKTSWEPGGCHDAIQDGSREWITLIAAMCADSVPLHRVGARIWLRCASGVRESAWDHSHLSLEEHTLTRSCTGTWMETPITYTTYHT